MTSEPPSTLADPAQLAADGADAGQVAAAAVAVWHEVDVALSPIIGPGGVAALYKRCLVLARPHHPWLAAVHEQTQRPGDFGPLQTALAHQPGTEAAAAHLALLQTYRDTLIRLIGASLTERLLRPAGPIPPTSVPMQDTSP